MNNVITSNNYQSLLLETLQAVQSEDTINAITYEHYKEGLYTAERVAQYLADNFNVVFTHDDNTFIATFQTEELYNPCKGCKYFDEDSQFYQNNGCCEHALFLYCIREE